MKELNQFTESERTRELKKALVRVLVTSYYRSLIIYWLYLLDQVRNIRLWAVWHNAYNFSKSGYVHISSMWCIYFCKRISFFKYHFISPIINMAGKIYIFIFNNQSLREGLSKIMASRVHFTSFLSWRLVPSTVTESGITLPSV